MIVAFYIFFFFPSSPSLEWEWILLPILLISLKHQNRPSPTTCYRFLYSSLLVQLKIGCPLDSEGVEDKSRSDHLVDAGWCMSCIRTRWIWMCCSPICHHSLMLTVMGLGKFRYIWMYMISCLRVLEKGTPHHSLSSSQQ